ncbi:hypothetical protein Tco_0242183 [Tanacetum coccineum]
MPEMTQCSQRSMSSQGMKTLSYISWKSCDDNQDDKKAQDDEDEDKNDVNETTQDDEDDDIHDDDENAQDDDDEAQTESEDDGDDFIHPKLTTHDDEIIHEEETNEDDTFDPIVHLPPLRDDVMTDVILPLVQATQEIEDTHMTLTLVNPDGQQQSSSVSSGFVSNMLISKSRYAVLIAILLCTTKSSSNTEILRHTQLQQPPILTPEAVDVAVQLKYDRIREESNTKNQQFLDSIDEGMKKVIKEQVKKEVSKITPKIEKLVIEQLESEVLVRSSKEATHSQCSYTLWRYGHNKKTLRRSNDGSRTLRGTDRGPKEEGSGNEPAFYHCSKRTTTRTAGKTTSQPLPLVPNAQGRHVIPFHHFINNDLEYLRGGGDESSRKLLYFSYEDHSAADYGLIK